VDLEVLCEAQWTREVKSLIPSSSGTGNLETWLLRLFHGEKDRRKCDSKNFFEKHSACTLCSEKMAMECRQVSTCEHEGERSNSWETRADC
jgi:hypothetical protein